MQCSREETKGELEAGVRKAYVARVHDYSLVLFEVWTALVLLPAVQMIHRAVSILQAQNFLEKCLFGKVSLVLGCPSHSYVTGSIEACPDRR